MQLHFTIFKTIATTFYYICGWLSYIFLLSWLVHLHSIMFPDVAATFTIVGASAASFLLYLGLVQLYLLYLGLV